MVPRHNLLSFIYTNNGISSFNDFVISFDRLNTDFYTFDIVLKDLIKNRFIIISNYHITPDDLKGISPPIEKLNNIKIYITDEGRRYADVFIFSNNKIQLNKNNHFPIYIDKSQLNVSYYSNFKNADFATVKNSIRFKNPINYELLYFIITGKHSNDSINKVFISYSWDNNEAHKKWVKSLASLIKENGYDVMLDQFGLFRTGKNKEDEMKRAIITANKVLIILTPNYKLKAETNIGGAGFEYSVISKEMSKYITNEKFLPILRQGEYKESTPSYLDNFFIYDARKGKYRFNNLLDVIQ